MVMLGDIEGADAGEIFLESKLGLAKLGWAKLGLVNAAGDFLFKLGEMLEGDDLISGEEFGMLTLILALPG